MVFQAHDSRKVANRFRAEDFLSRKYNYLFGIGSDFGTPDEAMESAELHEAICSTLERLPEHMRWVGGHRAPRAISNRPAELAALREAASGHRLMCRSCPCVKAAVPGQFLCVDHISASENEERL